MFGMIIATHAVVKDDDLGWTEIVNAIDIPIIYKALGDEEDFIKDKDEYFEHSLQYNGFSPVCVFRWDFI